MKVIDVIEKQMMAEEEETRERRSYWPSEATMCLRKLFYKWTETQESNPIPPSGRWKMDMGNAGESVLREWLSKTGLELLGKMKAELDVEDLNYPISGEADEIINDEKGLLGPIGERVGIEVKTSYGNGVRAIKENGAKDDHVAQCILYMHMFHTREWRLIYVSRDDGYRLEFVITRDDFGTVYVDGKEFPKSLGNYLDRFRELEVAVELGKLPDREYRAAIKNGEIKTKFQQDKVEYRTDWQCGYCQFRNLCWKEELERYADSTNIEIFAEEE